MKHMRPVLSFGLSVLCAAAAAAQGPSGAPFSSQSNALGGRFASGGMGRPLGGINPGRGRGDRRRNGDSVVVPFGYSYYVPGYVDAMDPYGTASTVAVYGAATMPMALPPIPQSAPPAPSQPTTVIINQYFNGTPAQAVPANAGEGQPTAGAPLGPVENYYLIAYKDHSIYTVLAYWLEDKTLHYVTTHNEHNQASVDLIDLDLTKRLNDARNVPFALAAN